MFYKIFKTYKLIIDLNNSFFIFILGITPFKIFNFSYIFYLNLYIMNPFRE